MVNMHVSCHVAHALCTDINGVQRNGMNFLHVISNSGLVIIDTALTAVGGYDGSHFTNKLFTLQQRQWVAELPPMKTARSETAVVSTSDREYVLVIGGGDGGWTTNYSRTISSEQ